MNMNRNFMFWKKPEDTPPPDTSKLLAEMKAMNRIYSWINDIVLVLGGVLITLIIIYL